MIDSEGGAFGFDCYLASPEFRVFQQPARTDGPVFDREDTTLDHDLTGRDLRGRLGWPSDRPPLQHRTEQAGLFAKRRSRGASMTF